VLLPTLPKAAASSLIARVNVGDALTRSDREWISLRIAFFKL
jgi:hypothetical protein